MSQTSENFLPAASGQDLGSSPSQEWDLLARNVSISGPINLVPEGEGQAGQVVTSGGPGNPAGWSTGGVNIVGGSGISVSTSGSTVTVTNTSVATPASPDTSVQFNDGGVFGGDARFTWHKGDVSSGAYLDVSGVVTVHQNSSDPIENSSLIGVKSNANVNPPLGQTFDYAYSFSSNSVGNDGLGTVTDAAGFVAEDGYNSGTTSTVTNLYGVLVKPQTAGTHNYGIKIGNVGTSTANDWALRTGWGKSTFGADADNPITIWASDTDWGSDSTLHIPVSDTFILGTKSNNHTDSHVLMSATANFPQIVMSAIGSNVPTIDLYGNAGAGGHLQITSDQIIATNIIGAAHSFTNSNATGSSGGMVITASSASVGGTGIALELTGAGDGYEKSIALQIDSGSRALCSGGVTLNTSISKPTASSTIRGTLWVVQGAAGVADKIQIVLKDAANAYAWHDITFV